MKAYQNTLRTMAMLAAALSLSAGVSAFAADEHLTMKGAQHLLHLNTPEKAEALKKGDTVAMVCSKCKTVAVTRVEKEWRGGKTYLKPGTKHGCAGCRSEITVVGQRMDQKEIIKHVCKSCGDDSAFCCATSKDPGATKGMEKAGKEKKEK